MTALNGKTHGRRWYANPILKYAIPIGLSAIAIYLHYYVKGWENWSVHGIMTGWAIGSVILIAEAILKYAKHEKLAPKS